jgi:hypothetical protein
MPIPIRPIIILTGSSGSPGTGKKVITRGDTGKGFGYRDIGKEAIKNKAPFPFKKNGAL